MQEIIDTHCHLDNSQFDIDRDAILQNCSRLGIRSIVVPAVHRQSWDKLLKLCMQYDALHPALGLHPVYIDQHQESDIEDLHNYLSKHRVIAVGEIGLDFYIRDTNRDKQIEYLERQLALAEQFRLPVLLHVRKAHNEMLKSLKQYDLCGGIAHAYSGSYEQAQDYIDLGFKLGFGGVITYEASTRVRRLAQELPLEVIVLETDAPDMSGALHRGQRNSPEYLPDALRALAQIRQQQEADIAKQTTQNARELFKSAL